MIEYAVKCTKAMAQRFHEHRIHPSQKIEPLKGELFMITFTVHDSFEVVRLLAQYGECIKEISPAVEYERVKAIWRQGLFAA